MDKNDNVMGPDGTEQNQETEKTERKKTAADIEIWQPPKRDAGRKNRYVYEVTTQEPQDENQTDTSAASGADQNRRNGAYQTADQSDRSSAGWGAGNDSEGGISQNNGSSADGTGKMGQSEGSSADGIGETGQSEGSTTDSKAGGNEAFSAAGDVGSEAGSSKASGSGQAAGASADQNADSKDRKKSKRKFGRRKKAQNRDTGTADTNDEAADRRRESGSLLTRDNLSEEARQEIWKGQVVEGTLGQTTFLQRLGRNIRNNLLKIILVVLIAAVVLTVSILYNRNRTYSTYEVLWQTEAVESSNSEYLSFNGVILHYSQDGVSCMDLNGEVLWNQAFNMDVPGIAVKGEYAVIYDIKGTSFYIFTAEGCTGYAQTVKNILKADISASGVTAVVLDDTTSNYINYYEKDGTQLDIEIKTLISGDGYPLDIAISPDGTQLISSYMYADSGSMLNQVVFRNFEVGKNNADRVVGGFRQYEETLVAEVLFFDDQNSAAVTENSIDFYSTKNALEPELAQTREMDERIKSVFYNEEYIGVVLNGTSGTSSISETQTVESAADEGTDATDTVEIAETAYAMIVYDKTGKEVFEQTIDFEYENIRFSGDGIVVYNNSELAVYNMTGVCKFHQKMDSTIEDVMRFSEDILVLHANGALQKLELK